MKIFYLIAAVIGAIVPWFFFAQFFDTVQGAAVSDFIPALFVNGAAGGFSADLLISSFVFWAFMIGRGAEGPKPWPFIALNLLIGLSCALPAYLYFSLRRNSPGTHS